MVSLSLLTIKGAVLFKPPSYCQDGEFIRINKFFVISEWLAFLLLLHLLLFLELLSDC